MYREKSFFVVEGGIWPGLQRSVVSLMCATAWVHAQVEFSDAQASANIVGLIWQEHHFHMHTRTQCVHLC